MTRVDFERPISETSVLESQTMLLLENRTDNTNYLKFRVVGCGAGKTNKAAVGVRVELWDAAGTTFPARRDLGSARGHAGSEPGWAHIGGVTNSSNLTVKVYLDSRANNDPLSATVVPASTSTTIGGMTISQMLTVSQTGRPTVLERREIRNSPG